MLWIVQRDKIWRAGFEVEVILNDLNDPRFDYGIHGPMDEASLPYCREIARRLQALTGDKWIAPARKRAKPGFFVVPEYGVDPLDFPRPFVAGVELITPPLLIPDAERLRQRINDAIADLQGDENFWRSDVTDQCGWHINIDPEGRSLDAERFILAVDELPILGQNDRVTSSYAAPQRHSYGITLLRHATVDQAGQFLTSFGVQTLVETLRGDNKSYAANFGKLVSGYIELRHFSAYCFFNGPPLNDLLDEPITAFEMSNEANHACTLALIQRFRVLADWFKRIEPKLRHTTERCDIVNHSGVIRFGREKIAETRLAGLADVHLLGSRRYDYAGVIRRVPYPDIMQGIALLALDQAELRHHKLDGGGLKSPSFSSAVDDLIAQLDAAGLWSRPLRDRGHWWGPV